MVGLAIHGGAGGDGPWKGPTDLDPQRIACMQSVLTTVGTMLQDGIDALEAVTIAVEMLENEPLFMLESVLLLRLMGVLQWMQVSCVAVMLPLVQLSM